MAYTPIKSDELKQLVMMGKRRPMNFAYNPGPKDADLLIIDRKKAPDVIGRIAKKEGDGVKVAFGTFEIDAKTIILTTEQELPGMSKKFRKYLKSLGLSFSVEIRDPSGKVRESDTDEEEAKQEEAAASAAQSAPAEPAPGRTAERENAAEEPAAEAKQPDPAIDALKTRIRAAQGPIAALGPKGDPLKKALAQAVAFLKAGELAKCATLMDRIEANLAGAKPAAAPAQNEAKEPPSETPPAFDPKTIIARATSLKSVIDGMPPEDVKEIKTTLVQSLALLKARDYAAADAKLAEAESQLNARSAASAEAAEEVKAAPQETAENADTPAPENVEETEVKAAEEAAPETAEATENEAEAAEEKEDPDTSRAQAEWAARLAALQPQVDAAMAAKKGDLDGINRAFNYAKSQAEGGNFDSALKAAENTEKLLAAAANLPDDAGTDRVAEAADAGPDNVVAYTRSRLNWIKTRNGLQADLIKLKMTIDASTRGVEGLEEIAENTSVLLDYIEELDTSLEAALNRLVETPDGPQRDALKKEAIKIIDSYRSTLDSEFFMAVDDNGFTNTKIRSTALDALKGVETALAA